MSNSILKNIIKTLKADHYIKNLVVFIPIVFSMNWSSFKCCYNSTLILVAFCMLSSAVYIMNDLFDIEKDKRHPIKSRRPIASGAISKKLATIIFVVLFSLSAWVSIKINLLCFFAMLSYLILNILYSVWLKNLIIIDAACIAFGFIIRIIAGCFAIKVVPSALVIIMTFFISNLFTCIKRKLEIKTIKSTDDIRPSLAKLNVGVLDNFILINTILSISFYITYVLDDHTMQKAGTSYLYLTVIPFTLVIYRLFLLADMYQINDDPIIYLKRDKILKILFIIYLLVLLFVITYLK